MWWLEREPRLSTCCFFLSSLMPLVQYQNKYIYIPTYIYTYMFIQETILQSDLTLIPCNHHLRLIFQSLLCHILRSFWPRLWTIFPRVFYVRFLFPLSFPLPSDFCSPCPLLCFTVLPVIKSFTLWLENKVKQQMREGSYSRI